MKILHINTYNTGGAAIGAIRQHQALLAEGIDSKILFLEDSGTAVQEGYYYKKQTDRLSKRILKRLGLCKTKVDIAADRISELGLPFRQGGSYELFSTPYSIYEDLNGHPLVLDADLINVHWISGFIDISSFFKNLKKPIVWTLHDMQPYLGGFHYDVDLHTNPQFKTIEAEYIQVKKEAFKSLHFTIAGNSKWNTSQALSSQMFTGATSVETVYYPLPVKEYTPIEKPMAKKTLGLSPDKIVIGFACEDLQNPRKGFNLLLEAINMLSAAEKANICCLTFGKQKADIKLKDADLIQLGQIHSPRLQSIAYSAMDLFIIPSIAEAFGLTALEAMACKTPVIGANTGGIPEMIIENVTGYLFEPGHVESLRKKIQLFLGLPSATMDQLGQHAHQLVHTRHQPGDIAKKYINIYTDLISQ